jgi:hypothetical protein
VWFIVVCAYVAFRFDEDDADEMECRVASRVSQRGDAQKVGWYVVDGSLRLLLSFSLQRGFSIGITFLESLSHLESHLLAARQAGIQHGNSSRRITFTARIT